jgi:hypothetical protein
MIFYFTSDENPAPKYKTKLLGLSYYHEYL